MARDQSPVLPGTVSVRFRPWACSDAPWDQIPTSYTLSADLADADLGDAAGSPEIHSVRDSAHAIYVAPGGGDPTNKAALQTLANRIALDFWSWRLVAYDRNYNGVIVPAIDATVDSITWRYREDDCSTRMVSTPIGGEPTVFEHSDASSDCPNCVSVFPEGATVAHNTVYLPRSRLCLENGELVLHKDNPDVFPGCCNPTGCQTFLVVVTDGNGAGVPGVSVTFEPAGISGSTGSDGTFSFAQTNPPKNISTVTVAAPAPATTAVLSGVPLAEGNGICAARFTLCTLVASLTTVDGETGGAISGVTLAGPTDGGSVDTALPPAQAGQTATYVTPPGGCVQPKFPTPMPWVVVSGGTHTTTQVILTFVNNTDPENARIAAWGSPLIGGIGCLSGYWGGCNTIKASRCGVPVTGVLRMWSKSNWLYNPYGYCSNDRSMVLPKKLCLTSIGLLGSVVGDEAAAAVLLNWDTTSWDGDPYSRVIDYSASNGQQTFTSVGPNSMVFKKCASAGGTDTTMRCPPGIDTAPQDTGPYGSVLVKASFVPSITGGPGFNTGSADFNVAIEGAWDGACTNFDKPPALGTYQGITGYHNGDAVIGPLPCYPGPREHDCQHLNPNDPGAFYCQRDPRSYSGVIPESVPPPIPLNHTFTVINGSTTRGVQITVAESCGGSNPYNPYDSSAPAMSQSLPPLRAMTTTPPALVTPRPGIVETLTLLKIIKECPHRTAPSCGCPGAEGVCALGKGRNGGVVLNDCLDCQRTIRRVGPDWAIARPGTVRVGLWCPCLLYGGAETHQETLIRTTNPARISWVGAAVTLGDDATLVNADVLGSLARLLPVRMGLDAARDLAMHCDVVVSWAGLDAREVIAGLEHPPAVVAISHLVAAIGGMP